MIVEYDEATGRIMHLIFDPVPPEVAEFMAGNGKTFLDLPPTPWPPEPQFDAEGTPVMEPVTGDDGEPLLELVTDELGLPVMEDFTDPETGELGRRAVMRPVMRQVMMSNGLDYAKVDILADYVVDGEVRPRPACPASVSADGRVIAISSVPEGSEVKIQIDTEVVDIAGHESVELDEPGPVTVIVNAPWPYLEGRYDLEIE